MSSDLQDKLKENREHLKVLAKSDLRCSKYAKRLLESIEGYQSDISEEPERNNPNGIQASSEGNERSVFAY